MNKPNESNLISITATAPRTDILLNMCEQLYHVLKMHANRLSGEKIKLLTEQVGYVDIDFFKKFSERLTVSKMKPGDIGLIVQTQPAYCSGAVCLVEIVSVNNGVVRVRFKRYLKSVIPLVRLKEVEQLQTGLMVITVTEAVFFKILGAEKE